MEAEEFETSIGLVGVEPEGLDNVAVWSGPMIPPEWGIAPLTGPLEGHPRYPHVYLTLARTGDRWELESDDHSPALYTAYKTKVPMPPALLDELVKLGREWAIAHPEEFERASREEFEFHSGVITDVFTGLLVTLQDGLKSIKKSIEDTDFVRLGSPELKQRAAETARMFRAMKLQVKGLAEAYRKAEGNPTDEVA
jgi:hypothetical protein